MARRVVSPRVSLKFTGYRRRAVNILGVSRQDTPRAFAATASVNGKTFMLASHCPEVDERWKHNDINFHIRLGS